MTTPTRASSLCSSATRAISSTCGRSRRRRPRPLLVSVELFVDCCNWHADTLLSAENNLSFIETSALDANNVEVAFHNILKGESLVAAAVVK